MGINDIFAAPTAIVTPPAPTAVGGNPVAPVTAPVQPGNIPPPTMVPAATPGTAPNGVVPAVTPVTPTPAIAPDPQSPLAQFAGLWDNDPNKKPDAGITPTPLDKAALEKVVKEASFTGAVTPEMLASVTAGGEGAAEAFTTALNSVAQTVMMQSTLVQEKLSNQRLEEQKTAMLAMLPELVRQHSSADNLATNHPVLSTPEFKPIVDMLKGQMAVKHPTATAAELTTLTNQFMETLGTMVSPAAVQTPEQLAAKAAEFDWNLFLEPQTQQ